MIKGHSHDEANLGRRRSAQASRVLQKTNIIGMNDREDAHLL